MRDCLTGAALNRGNVRANRLLDPLLQVSMGRGVSRAALPRASTGTGRGAGFVFLGKPPVCVSRSQA